MDVEKALARRAGDTTLAIEPAVTAILEVARDPAAGVEALIDALLLLRWAQDELAALEPELIAAARAMGASWQQLAPALGVASRQAAS